MRLWVIFLAVLISVPAFADSHFRVKQMQRSDIPLGRGQCDIRLQVDDTVDVSLRGDTVFLHILSGREARDDGSECNAPLPKNEVRGFHFEVEDGRNETRLTQEPGRGNDFTATVRIHDTNGGYGRYHFRLTWMADAPVRDTITHAGPGPDRHAGEDFVWNNSVHYGGRGAGSAVYSDDDQRRLLDVSLDLDQGGHATVSFRTAGKGSLPIIFNGFVMERNGDRIKVDAMSQDHRLRGPMYISINDRKNLVSSVDMDATDGQDRVRVHWDRQ